LGCEIGLRNLIGKSGQKQSGKQSKRNKGGEQSMQTKKEGKQSRKTNKERRQTRKKNKKQKEKRKDKNGHSLLWFCVWFGVCVVIISTAHKGNTARGGRLS
jgi:cytoskeletal protein RodZ